MSQATAAPPRSETLADLIEQLGGVPADRILLRPWPGTATEADVLKAEVYENRLCELVDGVMVEKTMGFQESRLAIALAMVLMEFLKTSDLGMVTGADGMLKLFPGQVRIPDLAFFTWQRLAHVASPPPPIPDITPDLAVEILSEGNTRAEMQRKLKEYFAAGTRLVWYIDPRTRTATVFQSPDSSQALREGDSLEGGDVLPGFAVALGELFDEAERSGPRAR